MVRGTNHSGEVIHTVGVNFSRTHYNCVAHKPTATSVIFITKYYLMLVTYSQFRDYWEGGCTGTKSDGNGLRPPV